ncbi:MAG: L-threonylcarbamoyladenylate synthase [Pseudomonadales bacterium]|jgi:L-threonylcarbamoyladenylate synthase|nr:L-threonylcarbamoyladenylate synthase [Pseudomonadales bacterium]MDP7146906.1 L-threonylcarbamoyladenylate synthase [Pseudomonadales bacterium]MDP7360930.1 L-threonylcarbamoyladenylate synthase [Pseudomonadales bacterium]HJN52061.1 L-threonylcarbamoyladenylate synthase [Pseudomonadales bacterium]|tara:strand:+ start:698 stop:1255 length:558 start_codon:yes stop_codon:yes gene_type:complete
MSRWQISLVSKILWQGGIIAYPTEAVWGLGCIPNNLEGVLRILALKKRSMDKGVILVAADISQFDRYLEGLSTQALDHLQSEWPGPVTYLVEDNGTAPDWVVGDNNKVALRVSDHPVVKAICTAARSALVSTSANPSGRKPARNTYWVRKYFCGQLDMIFPGQLGDRSHASEIRDLASNRILREG